jgi:hypothetical protein
VSLSTWATILSFQYAESWLGLGQVAEKVRCRRREVEPAAFIVIKGEEVTISGAKPGKLEGLFEAVPGIIEKIQEIKKTKKEEEKK